MFLRNLFILMFFLFSISLMASTPMGKELSFYGKLPLQSIEKGLLAKSIRRGDRTTGVYGYKSGAVSPLVNSNAEEELMSVADQVSSMRYGKIQFSKIKVTKFQLLSDEDQKHLLKFYTWKKLKEKDWVVTVLDFKYLGKK